MTDLTAEQLESLAEYSRLRDAARNAIQHGVYPNAVKCLAAYDELTVALDGDLSEWAATHAATTAAVAPYIAQIRQLLESLVAIVEGVTQADPRVWPDVSRELAQDDGPGFLIGEQS